MAPDPNTLCARCGWRKSAHAVVADHEHVPVLVCPTATFDDKNGPRAHANTVDELLRPESQA